MQIAITRLEDCLLDVRHWMAHNGLQLNNDNTEWLIFNRNPDISIFYRNIGVRLEPGLTMLPHINGTCPSSYNHLRKINKIRKYLSDCGATTLIQALVISRMDYCNNIYHGLPIKSLNKKIKLVQNAAARVITKTSRRDHISPILRDLH